MKYTAIRKVQYGGKVWRAGDVLNFNGEVVDCPACKGKKEINGKKCVKCAGTGRSIPSHHFIPETEIITAPKDESEQIEAIRAEMTEMGAGFDRRWQLNRLRNELIAAKKSRGL